MTRWLMIVAAILAVLAGLAWIYRDPIYFMILAMRTKPDQSFKETEMPPPPDYGNADHWAALPNREDKADFTPPGTTDRQAQAPVDVFFIHPTTYLKPDHWNAPLDDSDANAFLDAVLAAQASVFNGCCKVYAPRYRQATFYSFFEESTDSKQALETAYKDVEAAFDHFLAHYSKGRPFILAAHSQGAKHLETLLKRRISASPLLDRMVAAYPVGWYIDAKEFADAASDIRVCASAEQTRCLVSWNALGPKAQLPEPATGNICVNPLTWRTGGKHAPHKLNLGAVSTLSGDGKGRVEPGAADAQCTEGKLIVSEIRSDMFDDLPFYLGKDNYHIIDYGLFYMNIRRNAGKRVDAHLNQ